MKVGQKVQVDRFLTSDPYNKKGQTGIITKIEDDIVSVKFSDNTIGLYEDDTLTPQN